MDLPQLILLFSGKRKSGKDYIAESLRESIGDEKCTIIRISEPIKSHFAKQKNLDLKQLMSQESYKEKYRKEMIVWSDEIRRVDPGYFCKAACEKAAPKQIWIVSDVRRKTDIAWFKETYKHKIKTVRIEVHESVRKDRGWVFTKGVDDVQSECDLDDYLTWDLKINNNNEADFRESMLQLDKVIQASL